MELSSENIHAPGASMEPKPFDGFSASDFLEPGEVYTGPDHLAEEFRLRRRHEVRMAWLELAKDLGVGLVLGLLASFAAFVGALAQLAGA